jgi:inosine-uridine nucleoside N-ribohydrolase
MKKIIQLSTIFFFFFLFGANGQQIPRLIIDTDMANDCDDVGAIAVAHALADKGEVEILAMLTNRKDPSNASAGAIMSINQFYGRPDIPIGTAKYGGLGKPAPSPYATIIKNMYAKTAPNDDQMPDAISIYRKILASQPDSSVTICSIGLLTNLADLLRTIPDKYSNLTGVELVKKKVKRTVIMGGGFPRTHTPETNIRLDPEAASFVTNFWTSEIYWVGYEVGTVIFTGEGLKQKSDNNPVKMAYKLRPYRTGFGIDMGNPSYDQIAILLSVRTLEPLFRLSEAGVAVISSDGHTEWKPTYIKTQNQKYVILKNHPHLLEGVIEGLMMAEVKEKRR